MKPSLTDTLCSRCGLCCDGSLFADIELASGDEATALNPAMKRKRAELQAAMTSVERLIQETFLALEDGLDPHGPTAN